MLKQTEGSHAIAEAVALCRPEVICAYPITPQTHIVEGLGEMVKSGELQHCEFINVESEFAALSVAIGSSAAGARSYTATASQGILFMAEAVYNAAGVGAAHRDDHRQPRNRCADQYLNDHSDSMALRDAGWIQLLRGNQPGSGRSSHTGLPPGRDAVLPGDGVRRWLHPHPPTSASTFLRSRMWMRICRRLNRCRCSIATSRCRSARWSGRGVFRVRYLQHHKQLRALELIPHLAAEFEQRFGRNSGGLMRAYRCATPRPSSLRWARSTARSGRGG